LSSVLATVSLDAAMWAVPAKIGPSGTLKCSTINYEAPPTFWQPAEKG
jgi:hypothetical protein